MIIVLYENVRVAAGRIRKKFQSRALEWEHSVMIFLFGVIVIANPAIFKLPAFAQFWGGPSLWGPMSLGVGVLRITALCINGYMAKPTAWIRAIGSVFGIALFAGISYGFVLAGGLTTGFAMYPIAGIFGYFALSVSVTDIGDRGSKHDELG